jgi:hypothetical protein
MPENKMISLRVLWSLFFLTVVFIAAVTLYPFHFYRPTNDAVWLPDSPGLYFNGRGIAYTEKVPQVPLQKGISVEILLKERPGSKNWGPKEIISLYDGSASPSLLVGQWGGRIFLYSRFEQNKGEKWYRQFRSKNRLMRGKPQLVAFTLDSREKALYINGELRNRERSNISRAEEFFSGRLILGNSPAGGAGWWGEIQGVALYDRSLSASEAEKHSALVFQQGMQGLAAEDCLLLYTFEEGKGKTVGSIIGENNPFYLPDHRVAFIKTILNLKNMRIEFLSGQPLEDFVANIFFFIPYGVLLALLLFRQFSVSFFWTGILVVFSGGLLSLTVEIAQFFLPSRNPAITDVISNMLGSGIGSSLAFFLKKKK